MSRMGANATWLPANHRVRTVGHEQARDDTCHPAQAVFLVDSDCLPSESLLDELHSEEVQSRINRMIGSNCLPSESPLDELRSEEVQSRTNGKNHGQTRGGMELSLSHPAAIVVPCLEFAPGAAASRRDQVRLTCYVVDDPRAQFVCRAKRA